MVIIIKPTFRRAKSIICGPEETLWDFLKWLTSRTAKMWIMDLTQTVFIGFFSKLLKCLPLVASYRSFLIQNIQILTRWNLKKFMFFRVCWDLRFILMRSRFKCSRSRYQYRNSQKYTEISILWDFNDFYTLFVCWFLVAVPGKVGKYLWLFLLRKLFILEKNHSILD